MFGDKFTDGLVVVHRVFTDRAAGVGAWKGFCLDGERIISPSIVAKIFAGGDRDKCALGGLRTMKSGSYRPQSLIRNVEGRNCPLARGAYRQFPMIDPASEIAIAQRGSSKQSSSLLLDPTVFPTFDVHVRALRES